MDNATARNELFLPAIPPPDAGAARAARDRLDSLAKLPGSLGRLETLAVRLAGMTGQARPRFPRKAVALFVADHAIARHGLSSTGQEVTALQTRNFLRGGGTINAFARNAGAWLTVVDVGIDGEVDPPEADARAGDSPLRFLWRKVLHGAKDFSAGTAERNDPDPVETLARVGGPEIGAMAGFMIGAASRRVPVVVDGFIAGAAACVATALCDGVRHYLIGSHVSAEPGHRLLLQRLGVEPHFDFGLRLGEGTGAALFFPIIDAAVRVLDEMATLADLGLTLPPRAPGNEDASADATGARP